MKLIFIFLVASFSLFAEDFAFDKESGQAVPNYIGQLKMAKGKVFKVTANNKQAVKVGTRFYKNETLLTQEGSLAQIQIVDDSVMTLGANSELNFAEFKFTSKTDRQIVYSFIKGQIRSLIKNKAKEGDILFKTKMAVMAVRGTELLINHQSLKHHEISEFALLSGKVQITDEKKQMHDLKKNDRVVIAQNTANNQSANARDHLSPTELLELNHKEKLMNLFEPTQLNKASPLYSLFNQELTTAEESAPVSSPEAESDAEEKKGWQKNLKKLNEKLKEYQKK